MKSAALALAAFYLAGCASAPVRFTVAPADWTVSNPADRYGWASRRMCYTPACRKSGGFFRVGVAF